MTTMAAIPNKNPNLNGSKKIDANYDRQQFKFLVSETFFWKWRKTDEKRRWRKQSGALRLVDFWQFIDWPEKISLS